MNGTHTEATEVIEDVIIASGVGISLMEIQNILSIVLLCFNILWIIVKVIIKVIKYYRDGKLDDEEAADIHNDIDSLDDKLRK